jgi:hypothetical protein
MEAKQVLEWRCWKMSDQDQDQDQPPPWLLAVAVK